MQGIQEGRGEAQVIFRKMALRKERES